MGRCIIQVPSRKPMAYSNWQSRTICRKFEQKTIYRCGSEFKDPRQKSSSAPGDCRWINTFKPGSWNWKKVAAWNRSPERVPSQLTIPGQGGFWECSELTSLLSCHPLSYNHSYWSNPSGSQEPRELFGAQNRVEKSGDWILGSQQKLSSTGW